MPHKGRKYRLLLILVLVSTCWSLLVCFTNNDLEVVKVTYISDTTQLLKLGRYLFYDNRLSYNNTKSCASCHDQRFAFTDGYRKSIGIYGDNVKHNSLPLFNLATNLSFNWNDPQIKKIEEQLLIPLYNDTPHELGIKNHEEEILLRFKLDSTYSSLFKNAFPGMDDPFNFNNIIKSLATFCLSIKSYNSDYDAGNLSVKAQKGEVLFYSEKYNCDKCHAGPNFNQAIGTKTPEDNFQSFSLNEEGINDKYLKEDDKGLYEKSKKIEDINKFRIPTLRNLGYTAPYLHDGRAASLLDVLNIYENANKYYNLKSGFVVDSIISTKKKNNLSPKEIPLEDKLDLIAFLMSLNDSSLINDFRYQNPFKY